MSARSNYSGTYRSSKNRWGMTVWIDGAQHYLGVMSDRDAAAAYVRLVEARYPNRLRRQRGTIYYSRSQHGNRRWIALGPRPARERLGVFATRWAAERELKCRGIR